MTGRIRSGDPARVRTRVEPTDCRSQRGPLRAARRRRRTLLHLSHRGLGVRNWAGFSPGTYAFLDRLEAYLAGEPPPNWAIAIASRPIYFHSNGYIKESL